MIIYGADPYHEPSFSLSNRIARTAWGLVWLLLFRPSPRPLHRWRAFLLRVFGASLGVNCHVYPAAKIWAPWNLDFGDAVGIADGAILYSMDKIRIESYSVVSQGAHLCCGTHDYNSPNFQLIARPITIGKRVWICADAFVHPGVEIADGAVVGARSVVSKSLTQRDCVYAGVPARPVGQRMPSSK